MPTLPTMMEADKGPRLLEDGSLEKPVGVHDCWGVVCLICLFVCLFVCLLFVSPPLLVWFDLAWFGLVGCLVVSFVGPSGGAGHSSGLPGVRSQLHGGRQDGDGVHALRERGVRPGHHRHLSGGLWGAFGLQAHEPRVFVFLREKCGWCLDGGVLTHPRVGMSFFEALS